MTDILITGVYGQLGRAMRAAAVARGLTVDGHDLDTLDISNRQAVLRCLTEAHPRTVVNCAAYTAVDACETDEEQATAVNGTAVRHLAEACDRVGALLVQISTDYVFAGDGEVPYREDDEVGPATAYGRGKLLGEQSARHAAQHLIVRTAWLYGHGGKSFVEAIRGQLDAGAERLRVVADQTGSPTFSDDLAAAVLDLVTCGARGIVHAVNAGATTWHGLACAITDHLGLAVPVDAVTSAEVPRPARRPPFSVLAIDRLTELLGAPTPPWEDALARYLDGPCES